MSLKKSSANESLKKDLYELIKTDESVLNFILNSSIDVLRYWDVEHPEHAWMNPKFLTALGYDPNEMPYASSVLQNRIYPNDLKKITKNIIKHCEDANHPYDQIVPYLHKDGHTVWIHCKGLAIRDDRGKVTRILEVYADITALKCQVEILEKRDEATSLGYLKEDLALRETVTKLTSILDASTQVSIIGTDREGIINTFNKGAENLLGYTIEEVVNQKTPEEIHLKEELEARGKELSAQLGESISGFEIIMAYAKRGSFETREWTYVRKDGSTFPVQLTVTAIKNGEEIIGYLEVATEISEIKKAGMEINSLLAVTKDQNERLKNFAHIVSHNLRSHSVNLSMLLGLLKTEKPEINENELFQLLDEAAKNLEETIAHLNEVVIMNTTVNDNLVGVNLREAVDSAIANTAAMAIDGGVSITNDISADYIISGVAAYIDSILLNLLTNAIKYRSPDRQGIVKLSAKEENNHVILTIQDNGLGIDLKRYGSKLFGMYKTFHENADARGIGLFITKNQIEAMGGKVEVESEVNRGTTVKVYFNEKN